MQDKKRWIKIGGVCGLVGVVIFFGVAVLLEQLFWHKLILETTHDFLSTHGKPPYYQVNIAAHLILGLGMLFFIVAFVGLRHLLTLERPRISAGLGSLFGTIGCGLMVVQCTVQGTTMVKMGEIFGSASSDSQREVVILLYRGLRLIDQGVDLAFDTFFFAAWILLGYAMLSHKNFGKVFGAIGIALFLTATIVNVWSAPSPPTFDVSPIAIIWVIAVYVQMLRASRSVTFEVIS